MIIKSSKRKLLKRVVCDKEEGFGVIQIIFIIVVLMLLVIIFKDELTNIVKHLIESMI